MLTIPLNVFLFGKGSIIIFTTCTGVDVMVTMRGVRDITLPTVADILSMPVELVPDTLRIF